MSRGVAVRVMAALVAVTGIAVLAVGCGGKSSGGTGPTSTPTPNPNEAQSVRDARSQFPRFLDLQVGVLSTTCSPNPGVCHNSSNYPNFQTAGNTLSFVGAPCNAEIPDPLQGWDQCERQADLITIGTFTTELAWLTRIGPGVWSIGMKDAAPSGLNGMPVIKDVNGNVLLNPPPQWSVLVVNTAGAKTASLTVGSDDFVHQFVDSVLKTVIGGDPNRNGVWGAEDPTLQAQSATVFYPGSTARSYMFGRITATVPGTRMPLANAPLTEPAYVAIACWIEGLKGAGQDLAEDNINYDNCKFAKAQVDYTH